MSTKLTRQKGIVAGLALILIYSVQFTAARFSLQGHITAVGLTVIRFFAAGGLFIPYILFGSGLAKVQKLGFYRSVILAIFAGFPYLLVINTAISLTSAGYAATVGPGSIVLFSFLLPFFILQDRPDKHAFFSTMLITIGIVLFVYNTFLVEGLSAIGTALSILQGVMFSMYGVLVKRWQVDPVLGTATVALISCIPAVFVTMTADMGFNQASLTELIGQIVVQGFLAGAASVFLYTFTVQQLGPQRASLFMPSVPLITTVAGQYFLNEPLSAIQIIGLLAMVVGMAVPGTIYVWRAYHQSPE